MRVCEYSYVGWSVVVLLDKYLGARSDKYATGTL